MSLPTPGNKIIFKGGTSLSKGWNLIQHFRKISTSFSIRWRFSRHWGRRRSTESEENPGGDLKHPALTYVEEKAKR